METSSWSRTDIGGSSRGCDRTASPPRVGADETTTVGARRQPSSRRSRSTSQASGPRTHQRDGNDLVRFNPTSGPPLGRRVTTLPARKRPRPPGSARGCTTERPSVRSPMIPAPPHSVRTGGESVGRQLDSLTTTSWDSPKSGTRGDSGDAAAVVARAALRQAPPDHRADGRTFLTFGCAKCRYRFHHGGSGRVVRGDCGRGFPVHSPRGGQP